MNVGDTIRKYRRLKNHTQKSLALAVNAERVTILKYENSTMNMSLKRFMDICRVLEIPGHAIVGVIEGVDAIYTGDKLL